MKNTYQLPGTLLMSRLPARLPVHLGEGGQPAQQGAVLEDLPTLSRFVAVRVNLLAYDLFSH